MTNPPCSEQQHARLKSDSQWPLLGPAKYMPAYDDEHPTHVLALKNCALCNSTLAREEPAVTDEALAALQRDGLL